MIRSLYPQEVTFNDALDLCSVIADGFKNDPCFANFVIPRYQWTNVVSRTLCIKDPRERLNELVDKAKSYRRFVTAYAMIWYPIMREPGGRTSLMYDDDTGRVIGAALWTIPHYLRNKWPKVSRWFQFKTKLLSWYYWARVKLMFLGEKQPVMHPDMTSLWQRFSEDAGVSYSAKGHEAMAKMPYSELEKIRYTHKDYYYLEIFAIDGSAQGKGYGKKFFETIGNELPIDEATFKSGENESHGPPKAMIIATAGGARLYNKFGFKSEFTTTDHLETCTVNHEVMFKQLDVNKKFCD